MLAFSRAQSDESHLENRSALWYSFCQTIKVEGGRNVEESQEILEVCTLAAKALLESGAEIFRVQETVIRMMEHFGVEDYNVYVIANGFFINIDERSEHRRTAIRHVPLHAINLTQIARVNQISREVCQGDYGLEEAHKRLTACQTPEPEKKPLMVLASGVGAMGFCYVLGGGLYDSIYALLMGLILQLFLYLLGNRSKYLCYLLGAFLVTSATGALVCAGVGADFNSVVIGAIIPLVPGVSFSTSISELFNGDHVSGTIHLMDAVLSAACIAIGVGAAVFFVQMLGGNI
jgi:uncharacterized membrane protein YjjP (DUF1212 family)